MPSIPSYGAPPKLVKIPPPGAMVPKISNLIGLGTRFKLSSVKYK